MFDPEYPCRIMETRACPRSYAALCGDRPCARFESEDEAPWQEDVAWDAAQGLPRVAPFLAPSRLTGIGVVARDAMSRQWTVRLLPPTPFAPGGVVSGIPAYWVRLRQWDRRRPRSKPVNLHDLADAMLLTALLTQLLRPGGKTARMIDKVLELAERLLGKITP